MSTAIEIHMTTERDNVRSASLDRSNAPALDVTPIPFRGDQHEIFLSVEFC